MTKVYEKLTKRKQGFIDKYIECGDRNEAYKDQGYSIAGRGWKANARAMFIELQGVIQSQIDIKIGTGATLALVVVQDLMMNAKSESVKLQAAKDYLDRAGWAKPLESKVILTDERQTDEELNQEIQTLIKEAGIQRIGPKSEQ